MITIEDEFVTRREAEDFAKFIEESYPSDKFATSLNIQQVTRQSPSRYDSDYEGDTLITYYRVYGERQEKPIG